MLKRGGFEDADRDCATRMSWLDQETGLNYASPTGKQPRRLLQSAETTFHLRSLAIDSQRSFGKFSDGNFHVRRSSPGASH